MRSFQNIFLAVVIAAALIVTAFVINSRRPRVETEQPSAASVRATGKCAECHSRETAAIVHEFEMSRHAKVGVNCLDCHQAGPGQQQVNHRGFVIAKNLTLRIVRVAMRRSTGSFSAVGMRRRRGRRFRGRVGLRRSRSAMRSSITPAR
jgi:hypothetical protein